MCASTVLFVTNSARAMALFDSTFRDELEHLSLPLRQLVERAAQAAARDESRDDRRVDNRLALRDPPKSVDEHRDVEHAP